MPDASRSVPVGQNLLSADAARASSRSCGRVRAGARAARGEEGAGAGAAGRGARQRRRGSTGRGYTPPKPKFIGRRVFRNYDLAEIARYIDWGPFFQTWDLHGAFPGILDDEVVGESARRVFADGQAMLERVIDGRWLTANGVVAFLPANAVNDDDIEVYTDDTRSEVPFTWHNLRQQTRQARAGRATTSAWPTSSRRRQSGHRRLHRDVRGDHRPRRRAKRAASSPRARRLLVDHAQGDRRPAGRGLRRVPARARAQGPVGLRGRRVAGQRGADHRELPRHPPGARLSGLPRAHGQARDVRRAARRTRSAWR